MMLKIIEKREPELVGALVELWERSVRASHGFLSEPEILAIKEYVPGALASVPVLVVAKEDALPIGFMGIADAKLEMLFLEPEWFGRGVGRQLVELAIERYKVNSVVVNEQNPRACRFYERFGFRVVDRSPVDEQGQPYPILFLERMNDESLRAIAETDAAIASGDFDVYDDAASLLAAAGE